MSIAAARAGGEQLLGAFTIGFTGYLLVLGFSRSLFSEPLLSLPMQPDTSPDRAALFCAATFALPCGALLAAIGLLVGADALVAVAVVLPALLMQDLLRFAAFRRRRARRAAALDTIWLVSLLLTWPLLTATDSVATLVLLWGAGAVIAVAWGLKAGLPSTPRAAWRWWRQDARTVGRMLAIDSAVFTVTGQGIIFGLAGLLGTAQLGLLRAAQLLLGPATTLLVALNAFVLPRLASRAQQVSRIRALQICAVSAGASALAVGMSVAAAPAVSHLFFGNAVVVPTWLILLLGAAQVTLGATAGLVLHLKALRRLTVYTALRACGAIIGVALVLGAAARGGLELAAKAMLLQALLMAIGDVLAWQFTLRRLLRPRRETPQP